MGMYVSINYDFSGHSQYSRTSRLIEKGPFKIGPSKREDIYIFEQEWTYLAVTTLSIGNGPFYISNQTLVHRVSKEYFLRSMEAEAIERITGGDLQEKRFLQFNPHIGAKALSGNYYSKINIVEHSLF